MNAESSRNALTFSSATGHWNLSTGGARSVFRHQRLEAIHWHVFG